MSKTASGLSPATLRTAVARSEDVAELAGLVDYAQTAVAACKRTRQDIETTNEYAVPALEGIVKAGRLLGQLGRSKGGRPSETAATVAGVSPYRRALEEARLPERTARDWQQTGLIADAAIEAYVQECRAREEVATWRGLAKPRRRRGDDGPTPPLPPGVFDVVLADPPWRYDFAEAANRELEVNRYPTMETEAIAELEVPAAEHTVLFLWATSPKLPQAFEVLAGWDFDYVTSMVWVKDKIGMGYYARQRHEWLLIAKHGTPAVPDPSDRPDSVIEAPRGEHSSKPEIVYDLIETMYPDRTYLEMFARSGRDGWTSWGNEV